MNEIERRTSDGDVEVIRLGVLRQLARVPGFVEIGTKELAEDDDVEDDDGAEEEDARADGKFFSPSESNVGPLHASNLVESDVGDPPGDRPDDSEPPLTRPTLLDLLLKHTGPLIVDDETVREVLGDEGARVVVLTIASRRVVERLVLPLIRFDPARGVAVLVDQLRVRLVVALTLSRFKVARAVSVGALEDEVLLRLCRVVGLPGLVRRRETGVRDVLGRLFQLFLL